MSPVEIYEIHRATNGQRKVFNDGDVSLRGKRGGTRDGYVEVTVVARAIFGHRSEEDSQDHRWIASHHRLDLPIKIRNKSWLLRLHAFEYHEYLKAARRWESTGVSVPPLN